MHRVAVTSNQPVKPGGCEIENPSGPGKDLKFVALSQALQPGQELSPDQHHTRTRARAHWARDAADYDKPRPSNSSTNASDPSPSAPPSAHVASAVMPIQYITMQRIL